MTLGWRLAGDCDSCFAASFAEKRRRSRRRRWNIFADHRQQLSDLHAGSRRCSCSSLLTVELFHTVSPAGHSSRLSLTVVAGASTGSQSAPLLITATFFPNRCDRDLQFLGSFGTYDLSCCHYSCCYLVSLVILSGSANWYILVTLLDRGLHDIWSTFF